MKIEERVAVVTGGNRGIGLEVCRQLAAQGWTVGLGARSQEKADAAASEIDGAFGLSLDVTDEAAVLTAAAAVRERCGRLDALVNNAGIVVEVGFPSVLDCKPEDVRRTLETNTLGALSVSRAFVPLLLEGGGGNLVNVSSGMGGLTEMDGSYFAYRVSKTALNALTRVLHAEFADQGLRANSVCPGFVRTGLSEANANAPLSPEEGAVGLVWAATLRDGGPAGGFFRRGEPLAW